MPASWVDRWLKVNETVAVLQASHPLVDAVVEELNGRCIRIGDRWLADFASCNYLGLDLDPEVVEGIPSYLRSWGTHPSWSRMIASPALSERIECELRALLGAEEVLMLPTLTHIHAHVLPALAADGTVFVDLRAHKTIHDGAEIARARGATVRRFRHNDLEHLEKRLRQSNGGRRVIAVDGINSITGNLPDLPALADLARRYDALLYIDDAHGFGVIGERAPGDSTPYGRRGNALVRHFDESYDHIVLTGGMSKAYSSLAAFVACPGPVKRLLKLTAASYSYSGPSPVASLASTLIGLEVNARRGDELRTRLYRLSRRVLDHVHELGGQTSNTSAFPIIQLPLADPGDLAAAGHHLFARGIFALLVPHPIVPRSEVGIRLQLTAANTDEQVIQLLAVLTEIDERFGLRRADLEAPERALAALTR